MDTGGDTLPSESELPVLGFSSKALVFGLGHVMEKWYQILGEISNKKIWKDIFTFRKFKENLQGLCTNILLSYYLLISIFFLSQHSPTYSFQCK